MNRLKANIDAGFSLRIAKDSLIKILSELNSTGSPYSVDAKLKAEGIKGDVYSAIKCPTCRFIKSRLEQIMAEDMPDDIISAGGKVTAYWKEKMFGKNKYEELYASVGLADFPNVISYVVYAQHRLLPEE